jgi:ATP-binding cassette subfamily F protein 3
MTTNQNLVSHFSFRYPGTEQNIITNLNLNFSKHSKIALVASNGVGKSTILNQLWKSSFGKGEEVTLNSQRLYFSQHIEQFELNPQDIQQNYYELLLSEFYTSGKLQNDYYHEWLLQNIALPRPNYKRNLDAYIVDFGLNPRSLPNRFDLLSAGTQKKILISILLATNPKMVLADELTNHLDKQAIETLIQWLKNSESEWLIVDHNQTFLAELIQHYVFIPDDQKRKPLHFYGDFEGFSEFIDTHRQNQNDDFKRVKNQKKKLQKQAKELQVLAKANPDSGQIGKMKKANSRRLQDLQSLDIWHNRDSHKIVDLKTNKNLSKFKKDSLVSSVQADPLKLKIGLDKHLLVEEFKIYNSQRVRLVGSNGSGKSSLINYIKHKLQKSSDPFDQYISGSLSVADIDTKSWFWLEQVTNYPTDTNLNQYILGSTELMEYEVPKFLKDLEFSKFSLETNLRNLSLGEFIRLQLGILSRCLHQVKLLIMDEPGNYLDIYTQSALVEMLSKYQGALLLVTHDDQLSSKFDIDQVYDLSKWSN